jgi:hypothetical protein
VLAKKCLIGLSYGLYKILYSKNDSEFVGCSSVFAIAPRKLFGTIVQVLGSENSPLAILFSLARLKGS